MQLMNRKKNQNNVDIPSAMSIGSPTQSATSQMMQQKLARAQTGTRQPSYGAQQKLNMFGRVRNPQATTEQPTSAAPQIDVQPNGNDLAGGAVMPLRDYSSLGGQAYGSELLQTPEPTFGAVAQQSSMLEPSTGVPTQTKRDATFTPQITSLTSDAGDVTNAGAQMSYGDDARGPVSGYTPQITSLTSDAGDVTNRAAYGTNGLYNAEEVSQMIDSSGYYFSDADRRLAQQYPEFGIYAIQCKKEYAEATTPEAKALANANLEAMRKRLGNYSGGSDGSEYNPFPEGITDKPTYDQSIQPSMPTYDTSSLPEMPTYDTKRQPAMPTYDTSKLRDMPTYDPTELRDMPTYDTSKLRDMPEYDSTQDGDMPEYDPSNLRDAPEWDDTDIRGGLDEAIQKIRDLDPYDDKYDSKIQTLLDQILGRDEFSYDYQSDPAWQAYKKQYTREGQRAQADALAQAAAMTGGIPSSYATTAAAQAGNYYAAQMSDKIPELYQAAYDRYNAEGNRMLNNMNMLRGLANDDYGRYSDNYNRLMNNLDAERTLYNDAYGRYRDQRGDWESDRAFDYGKYRDQVSDWLNQRDFRYNQYLNQLGQWNKDRDFDYGQYLDQLGQWNKDRDFGYNQYLDQLGQWNKDRDFGYGQYRDQVSDWRDARDFDYGKYRDQVSDWRDARDFDYGQYRDQVSDWRDTRDFGYDTYRDQLSDWQREQDDAWQKQLDEAKLRAQLGDYSGYDDLYGTDGRLQELYDAMQAGSGGGGYTYTPEEPTSTKEITDASQLGNRATFVLKNAMNGGGRGNIDLLGYVSQQIDSGVADGTITEEEASYIMRQLGFGG